MDFSVQQMSSAEHTPSVIRIEPSKGWVSLQLRELWAYRELLYFLIWRDVKVRYKQTVLGAAWAVIQPVFNMIVFTLFFKRVITLQDGIPYEVFTLSALVPWSLFENGLNQSANSLVGSANLIKKVYFPRLTIPIATVLSGLVDFLLAFLILLGMMLWFGITPTINIVFLPFFVLLAILTSLGVGLWLSALNVQFRDIRYTIPFLSRLWFFATPIIYPSTTINSEFWRTIYGLNPMVGVVDGFRWALLGGAQPAWAMLAMSFIAAVLLLVTGGLYFRRMEKNFADVV